MSNIKSKQLSLAVICFSKDRPWQLQELIRSVIRYWNGQYEYWILYTFSANRFENAYQHLINEYSRYQNIHFIKETQFDKNVFDLINSSKSEYVCFHVDDMIFYRVFNITNVLNLLHDESNRLIAFFPKLNQNINFCHPANNAAPTPVFTTKLNYKKYNIWMPMRAKSDWNYIWDLCGTIYSKNDVFTIYNGIRNKFTSKCLSSPNKFEVYGNKLINLIYPGMSMNMFAACPKKSIMSVITINRVQNDYNVPIYNNFEKTIDELLGYFINERELDLHKYTSKTFNSVHISELFLLPKKDKLTKNRNKQIAVIGNENNNIINDDDDEKKEENDFNFDDNDIEEWKQWLLTQSQQKPKQSKQD